MNTFGIHLSSETRQVDSHTRDMYTSHSTYTSRERERRREMYRQNGLRFVLGESVGEREMYVYISHTRHMYTSHSIYLYIERERQGGTLKDVYIE